MDPLLTHHTVASCDNITELVRADWAYSLAVLLKFNTLVMESVSTHEVNSW